MEGTVSTTLRQVRELMDEVRERCLWYLRGDYYPKNVEEAIRVLEAIEKHADLATFRRASELRQWLLLHSKDQ